MTSDQALQRVQKLGERNPTALALGRMLSFAAVAEPALIRGMRLDLLPASSAADEGDLWFSNLIQSRSPGGLVFFPEVAEILRRGLTAEVRREAWDRTRQMHQGLRRAIRIEEELTYLGLEPEANRKRIEEVLRLVISAMVGGRSELANWAGRALPRFSSAVQNFESASVLRIAADLRLGRDPNLRERLAGASRMPAWIAAALPLLPRIRLGVTLKSQHISLGPLVADPSTQLSQSIEVPDTPSVAVEIRWTAPEGSRSKIVFVEKGESSQPERVNAGPIELITLANEAWTLNPVSTSQDQKTVTPMTISAYTDGYAVTLHWRSRDPIPGCMGFVVVRRGRSGTLGGEPQTEEVLGSAKAPYQRFSGIDRPEPREAEFSYRVVPIRGPIPGEFFFPGRQSAQPTELRPMEAFSSGWTDFIRVGPQAEAPISVVFNRTLEGAKSLGLSPQEIGQISSRSFYGSIAQPGNRVRQALGGDLLASLLSFLSQALLQSATLYVAMFEFDDLEILQLLAQMGERANIILSDGYLKRQKSDSSADLKVRLKKSNVHLLDRVAPTGKLSHNKFVVLCDSAGVPSAVWTGNVSWKSEALCARSNVAVTLFSPSLAQTYLDYWKRLASSPTSRELATANSENVTAASVGQATVRPWFTPVTRFADLVAAGSFIRKARQGVLFLLSEPGQKESLVTTILEQKSLYVMGAVRSGPNPALYLNGEQMRVSGKQIAFPLFDSLEQKKRPQLTLGSALQSRMIVIDPLGAHPVVLIGSHAFGAAGSTKNDENFVVIENDPEVARRCAAHVEVYCQHFRFRAWELISTKQAAPNDWQKVWFDPAIQSEAAFWMAEDSRAFSSAAPAAAAPAKQVRARSSRVSAKKAPAKKVAKKPAKKPAKKTSKKK